MSVGYDPGTYLCRADELKLGMVVVYGSGLRKRIIRLDLLDPERAEDSHLVAVTFDDESATMKSPETFLTVEVRRDVSPPGQFRP